MDIKNFIKNDNYQSYFKNNSDHRIYFIKFRFMYLIYEFEKSKITYLKNLKS